MWELWSFRARNTQYFLLQSSISSCQSFTVLATVKGIKCTYALITLHCQQKCHKLFGLNNKHLSQFKDWQKQEMRQPICLLQKALFLVCWWTLDPSHVSLLRRALIVSQEHHHGDLITCQTHHLQTPSHQDGRASVQNQGRTQTLRTQQYGNSYFIPAVRV